MDKAKAAVMENAAWIRSTRALADQTDMFAGMMGMHAQFTISDETMELAAANKPAVRLDTTSMWLRGSRIFMTV